MTDAERIAALIDFCEVLLENQDHADDCPAGKVKSVPMPHPNRYPIGPIEVEGDCDCGVWVLWARLDELRS